MSETIVIKEHSSKELNNCDLVKLHNYLKCQKLTPALRVTPIGIETKSWVGVIKYKKTIFQILPKYIYTKEYQENDNKKTKTEIESCILRNLIYMLSYTQKLDIRTNENAKLSASKNPFIEILIREFAKSLFDCLKRLTPKKYVREEDNLNCVKGKIKFTENIRYNYSNKAKFYCEYDEFSENNILNQLFFYVATCLYNISKDNYNKKLLKFIINYYSDVKLIRFDKFKAKKINLSRNQELFRKPFNLAKMFVEQTSVDLSKNKFENITLVWDMNKLFEEFIYEIMNKYKDDLKCDFIAQKGRKLLVNDYSKKRNTFVDIMIKKKDTQEKIVLDTKYKELKNINDFTNADVFQVSTYCLLHNVNNAILLYPRWDDEKIDTFYYLNNDEFDKNKNRYRIFFKTINLKYDYLGDAETLNNIKKDIKNILNLNKFINNTARNYQTV